MKTHTIERIDIESIAGMYVNGMIVPTGFTTRFPTLDDAHIKATSVAYGDLVTWTPVHSFDPSLTYMYREWENHQWLTDNPSNQRINVDLGAKIAISRVMYKNSFNYAGYYISGVQHFTMWGSNNPVSFADVTYADDAGWTQLPTDISALPQVVYSEEELKYINVTNTTPYQYYSFKFADNWGAVFMGIRRLELQTSPTAIVGSAYTLIPADEVCLATDTITVTLPTAIGIAGKQYAIKNIGSGTVTIATTEAIDGSGSWSLPLPFQSIIVVSDGANWWITASHL